MAFKANPVVSGDLPPEALEAVRMMIGQPPIVSALRWYAGDPNGRAVDRVQGEQEVMSADFTDHESRIIGQMMKAERTLPDDFWHVAALQELARVLARYEAVMTDEHCATVIGCGAFLARHGKQELAAEIQAGMVLARTGRA